MSSANRVWPVHLARASTLRKGLPTTFFGFPLLPLFIAINYLSSRLRRFAAHARCGQFDRFVNLYIACAATQIPRERLLDFFSRRLGIFLKQFFRSQQKTRRAVPALRCAQIGECFLYRVKLAAFGHAFDGPDPAAFGVESEHETRKHWLVIYQHRADAAFAKLAAMFCSCQ